MIDDSKLVASLLEEGLADQASIDALRVGTRGGRSLYELLIRNNVVEEPKVVGVASRVLNVPMGHVPDAVPTDILNLVPASIARRNRAVPLGKSDSNTLVLAMANPTDELGRDEVAMHAGLEVEVVLIGPATLEIALERFYPETIRSSDAALNAIDDGLELQSYGQEMPGEEWSDYFDDESSEADLEDSAVLSRDMQDRPSTDVLAEELMDEAEQIAAEPPEEELPEIEIIEELGRPVQRSKPPSPYATLDNWEVDEAIGGSAIVSAADAESLFESSEGEPVLKAAPEEEPVEDEGEEEIIDETSQLSMEPSEGHTDALETHSKTSVGIGVEHLKNDSGGAARPKRKKRDDDNTGRTERGTPKSADTETNVEDGEGTDDDASPKADAPVDYAALGRSILRSKPKADVPPEDTNVTEMEAVEKKSKKVALFEDDDEELPKVNAKTTHARGAVEPADQEESGIEFPEDIDANGLAAALAALLVGKGVLSIDELVSLARELTVKK